MRRAARTLPAVVLLLLHFLVDRSPDDALVDASKRLQAKKQPIVNVKATAKGKGKSRSGKGGGRRGGGGGGGGSAEFMGGEAGAAVGAGDVVGEGASSEVGAMMGAMGAAGERGEEEAAVKAADAEAAEERERFDMLLDGVATDARVFRTRGLRPGHAADPTLGFACYRAAIPHAAHEPVSIVRFEPVVTRPEAGPGHSSPFPAQLDCLLVMCLCTDTHSPHPYRAHSIPPSCSS